MVLFKESQGSLEEKSELSFLVVSDVHAAFDKLERLAKWSSQSERFFDAILCAGDIADMPMDVPESEQGPYEAEICAVLSALENVRARVVYVPGNHDPMNQFRKELGAYRTSMFSLNIHEGFHEVYPGLVVCGYGGSCPSYDEHGEKVWDGYPFYRDEDMRQGLETVASGEALERYDRSERARVLHSDLGGEIPRRGRGAPFLPRESDSIIMLVHTGPFSSRTTVDPVYFEDKKIFMGSREVEACALSDRMQRRAAICIHGHTHAGYGEDQCGSVPVLNPGSLRVIVAVLRTAA